MGYNDQPRLYESAAPLTTYKIWVCEST